MNFSDFMCVDALVPDLKAASRDGAIAELVQALAAASVLSASACKEVTNAVIKRENEASTGLGKGVAVPHVKHKSVKKVTATIGRSSVGIDFRSLDKQPVYSIILIVSPVDSPEVHLQAMEKVFMHLQRENFRKFLRQSQTARQIQDLLNEADANAAM
ncbi:MAG TPA: PTS sugar transporter subunit IIA [Sedimentisphaerales bacterium]|nr:PTS sugar transporter subunit IIA [Sedimentisphaerales bacterium]